MGKEPTVKSLIPDFPDVEDRIKIAETYPLDHAKLPEIIRKFASKAPGIGNMFLRQHGLEIYVRAETQEGGKTSIPAGMLVTGAHLGKEHPSLYLVTFKQIPEKGREVPTPKYSLVNLVREYII